MALPPSLQIRKDKRGAGVKRGPIKQSRRRQCGRSGSIHAVTCPTSSMHCHQCQFQLLLKFLWLLQLLLVVLFRTTGSGCG